MKIVGENSDSRIVVGIVDLIDISLFGTSSASMAQSPTSIVENRGRDCPFSDRIKNDLPSSFRRHNGAISGRRTPTCPA